ncbi:DUF6745 domain-containing protein [Actinomadura rugatobispora]|uniref:DUF6745 domain-containing protein n=1 Tax=Actinomadura rugatobispora TaxID=1994 RepID=A0ABW1AI31_9ACTN|nr:hypothetical protein GCM10010200_103040 [Actinomadura rugatobispora]
MSRATAVERFRRALPIRDEWLDHALSTLPSDRVAAEAAVTELYRLIGKDAPRFCWVESPAAALSGFPPGEPPRLRSDELPAREADWPTVSRLASLMSALRGRLDALLNTPRGHLWRQRPTGLTSAGEDPEEALREGADLQPLLDLTVRDSLTGSVRDGLTGHVRTALRETAGNATGLPWYGQHDAYWIAHHDVPRRLGMASYGPADDHQLDLWAALARSCGWWWPDDGVCVMAERTTAVHTEPVPGSTTGEVRLHNASGPALRYADGWSLYAWHGTRVPAWVVEDPNVRRIDLELNVEVRRCAIEHLGWDTYIEQAGLALVASSPDPGNPGCALHLYEMPLAAWGGPARVLLAVNGSVERDGHRRRYGLSVPAALDDPVAAAGWSYGLTGDQYARLVRRT